MEIKNMKIIKGGTGQLLGLPGMSMKKLCDFKYTLETKAVILSDNKVKYTGKMCRKYVHQIKKS